MRQNGDCRVRPNQGIERSGPRRFENLKYRLDRRRRVTFPPAIAVVGLGDHVALRRSVQYHGRHGLGFQIGHQALVTIRVPPLTAYLATAKCIVTYRRSHGKMDEFPPQILLCHATAL